MAEGLLLEGIQAEEWRLLDDFEDDVYDLAPLTLVDGRIGWAYVCVSHEDASTESWDGEAFSRRHLAAYLENCRAWRERRG